MFSWGNTTQDLRTFSPLMALALILMENSSRRILIIFKSIHQSTQDLFRIPILKSKQLDP